MFLRCGCPKGNAVSERQERESVHVSVTRHVRRNTRITETSGHESFFMSCVKNRFLWITGSDSELRHPDHHCCLSILCHALHMSIISQLVNFALFGRGTTPIPMLQLRTPRHKEIKKLSTKSITIFSLSSGTTFSCAENQ